MKAGLFFNALAKLLAGTAAMALLLFLPAGTLHYPGAWRLGRRTRRIYRLLQQSALAPCAICVVGRILQLHKKFLHLRQQD